jgi:hypothetical protein
VRLKTCVGHSQRMKLLAATVAVLAFPILAAVIVRRVQPLLPAVEQHITQADDEPQTPRTLR